MWWDAKGMGWAASFCMRSASRCAFSRGNDNAYFCPMESAKRARILVIDDHPEHLDYLATLLRRAGYVVAAFDNAIPAMRYIAHCPVNLIITDVFMPEMDGFEVLQALQQSHPAVPLVAISGSASSARTHFLAGMKLLGAQAIFTKPFDAAALLDVVSLLVDTG
jgi:CheY-like chemotaxis protein